MRRIKTKFGLITTKSALELEINSIRYPMIDNAINYLS